MASLFEDLREHYLALVAATLAGTIYEDAPLPASGATKYDPNLREYGWDWPSKAFTMIGVRRLANLRAVVESVIGGNIPGDIMETGVWRGGASIMARAVLAAYGVADRRVILADSFAGLPPPDTETYPADTGSDFHRYPELAVSLEEVQGNFARFGLLDDRVVFLPGLFRDTLPTAPVERLAVLRLDGDMYESTVLALDNLYDRVSPNGWVIVDDYEVVPACKQAVQDFIARRGLALEIFPIDGVGVFFRKPFDTEMTLGNLPVSLSGPAFGARTDSQAADLRDALLSVMRSGDALAEAGRTRRADREQIDTLDRINETLRRSLDASDRALDESRQSLEVAALLETDLRRQLATTTARLDRIMALLPMRVACRIHRLLQDLGMRKPAS